MQAQLPPMGWNSWNQVQDDISETVVLAAATALVERGLLAAGYDHVVVDDGWQAMHRASDGRLRPDPDRFPSGIKALADAVHSLGLKFGIYSAPGTMTCAGRPGSYGHEQQDAEQFAEWGVDFLKYDWCGAAPANRDNEIKLFGRMARALASTGRPVLLSISDYGVAKPWDWANGLAQMYRTTLDIWPTWSSVYSLLNQHLPTLHLSRPGAWADPDMLQVGNGDLTPAQNHSHMALWCMMSAPLFIGTDLTQADPSLIDLLCSPTLLAIDQDADAATMTVHAVDGQRMIFHKPLSGQRLAVAVLNHTAGPIQTSLSAATLGTSGFRIVRDEFGNEVDSNGWECHLEPHATAIYLLEH